MITTAKVKVSIDRTGNGLDVIAEFEGDFNTENIKDFVASVQGNFADFEQNPDDTGYEAEAHLFDGTTEKGTVHIKGSKAEIVNFIETIKSAFPSQ